MADRHLRFGIFLAPFHSPDENPTYALERDLDLIVHLDKLGYDEAWIGEHHSGGYEIIASPEVFIAFAAEGNQPADLKVMCYSIRSDSGWAEGIRFNGLGSDGNAPDLYFNSTTGTLEVVYRQGTSDLEFAECHARCTD